MIRIIHTSQCNRYFCFSHLSPWKIRFREHNYVAHYQQISSKQMRAAETQAHVSMTPELGFLRTKTHYWNVTWGLPFRIIEMNFCSVYFSSLLCNSFNINCCSFGIKINICENIMPCKASHVIQTQISSFCFLKDNRIMWKIIKVVEGGSFYFQSQKDLSNKIPCLTSTHTQLTLTNLHEN